MTSPRVDPTDLPPGPDRDASVASPALAEQKAELKDTELPKDTPTETDDPDRVVTPNDRKSRRRKTPSRGGADSASQESVAAEATATPSTRDMQQGPRSVAPAQGTGETRAARSRHLAEGTDRASGQAQTLSGERSHKSAEIVVAFALDRMGHVLSTNIVKGSGDTAFDEAALAMVRRSDPVPQPPPLVADEGLSFTLPVIFRVKGKS